MAMQCVCEVEMSRLHASCHAPKDQMCRPCSTTLLLRLLTQLQIQRAQSAGNVQVGPVLKACS